MLLQGRQGSENECGCPMRVTRRHSRVGAACPLYPRKWTSLVLVEITPAQVLPRLSSAGFPFGFSVQAEPLTQP